MSLDPVALLGLGVISVAVLLILASFVLPQHFVRDLPDLGPPPDAQQTILLRHARRPGGRDDCLLVVGGSSTKRSLGPGRSGRHRGGDF